MEERIRLPHGKGLPELIHLSEAQVPLTLRGAQDSEENTGGEARAWQGRASGRGT